MKRDSAKSLHILLLVVCAIIPVICALINPQPVSADGGGWIGNSGLSGGNYGGTSSGSESSCRQNYRYKYMLDCTGYSWIFYRSTGASVGNVNFVPFTSSGRNVTVPKICSEHTDKNGGFWHLGRNAMGMQGSGISYAYFADNEFAGYYGSSDSIRYFTEKSKWGHLDTYQYGSVPNGSNWATYRAAGSRIIGSGIYLSNNNLHQDIYFGPTRAYYANRYGTTSEVLTAYRKAYAYMYPNASQAEINAQTLNGVWGFCYWDDMEDQSSKFRGRTEIKGAATDNTGWQNTNTTKTVNIENCSSASGCKVTFSHALQRTSGKDSTNWTVSRTSNLTNFNSTKAIANNSNVKSGTFQPSASGSQSSTVHTSQTLTLYPGMVVCEQISFTPSSDSRNTTYTRICASALGNAQPGDSTLVSIQTRNRNVAAYNKYSNSIYAKPTDTVEYRAIYNPVLQYTYYLVPQKIRIGNGSIFPASGTNTSATLPALYNLYKSGSLRNWNNAFSVTSTNFDATPTTQNYSFPLGSTTSQTKTNTHIVASYEAGRSLDEVAQTNLNSITQTTPGQVSFTSNGGANLANINTSVKSATASVLVPYNFQNSTEITDISSDSIYAGESASVRFKITTSPKRNNVTDGTYATIARNAKWKLEISYRDPQTGHTQTASTSEHTGNLNGGYSITGSAMHPSIRINIPDVPAGTDLCFRSAVYPATSGADTNWNNYNGDGTWAYSEQKCFRVAKRPSIEVWGGNTYSRGAISLTDAVKTNLAHYANYNAEGNPSTKYVFGSWTELGLVTSGAVKGLSSGASLGFAANDNGNLWPGYHPTNGPGNNSNISDRSPGGSDKTSLCDRSPLTFANTPCTNSSNLVGSLGGGVVTSNAEDDKKAIISKYIFGGDANIIDPNNVTLNNPANLREGTNIYYYNGGSSNLTLSSSRVAKSTIQVVHSRANITINGDLIYEDSYTAFSEIPKLVIYAEGELRISCAVSRIDAVLIADDVLTCDNLSGDGTISDSNIKDKINSSANSNQLKINGAVITGELHPNRTYGAATGANSMIPAEIINFDPSLYVWGTTLSTETTTTSPASSNNLNTVYRQEIPPRY